MRVLTKSSRRGQHRWMHLASLIIAIALVACGSGPAPTATPKPGSTAPAGTGSPSIGQSQNKIARVFLQLLVIYQTQGLDVARNFALDQGLLTQQDEVRATLVLDSADPAIVESTAQSVERLGGRVTQTYENRIEFVMLVQPLLEYGKKTNRTSFFHDLADFSHVKTIQRTVLIPTAETATPSIQPTGTAKPMGGISEGVARTGADIWQAAGITGKGVRVGVIDNNFTNYRQFLTGAKVTAKSFRSDGLTGDAEPNNETIHGAACAEIIHEMAPDAELYLASVDTDGSYLNALSWLTNTVHVSVISSSLGSYGNTPTNDTSYRSLAIDKAKRAGIFFANSAGNEGSGAIGSSSGEGHYAATFSDMDDDGFHNFVGTRDKNGIVFAVRRKQRVIIVLNWDDWKDPHVNYDLYLYDSAGKEIARSDDDQAMGFDPIEIIYGTVPAGRYTIKIKKVNTTDADLPFNLYFHGGQLEQITPQGSLSAPSDARGAVSVAAIDVTTDITEDFSSEGPTLDGRKKPDIGAPDSNTSYAYASVGMPDFLGTSAAAPHVAGAAALYKQAFPESTPDMILKYFVAHAKMPKGTKAGENLTGAGLLFLDSPPLDAESAPLPTTIATPLPLPSSTARQSTVAASPAKT